MTSIEMGTLLTDFSASRITTLGHCGRKFKYHYVDKVPRGAVSSALIVGSIMHDGMEAWFRAGDHQDQPLWPHVQTAWDVWLEGQGELAAAMHAHRLAAAEAAELTEMIHFKRPDLKNPTGTKEYLSSPQAKQVSDAVAGVLEVVQAQEDQVQWAKDELPHVVFEKTRAWSASAEQVFAPLAAPLAVELPFQAEIAGYRIQGRIDQLRIDPNEQGEAITSVLDYKTSRNPLSPMLAALQSIIYAEATRQSPELPTADRVAFYLVRTGTWQPARVDPDRHLPLIERIVRERAAMIEHELYAPSYGMWCDRCEFRDMCAAELDLWLGAGVRDSHLADLTQDPQEADQ